MRSSVLPSLLLLSVAALPALPALAADEKEPRFFPTEPDWAERFAVDVKDGPLAGLTAKALPIMPPLKAATYDVTFKGELAGFDIGRVFITTRIGETGYDIAYEMQQRGIARWFSDGNAKSRGTGTFDGRRIDGGYYFNHDVESEDDFQKVELVRQKGERRLRLWTNPEYWFYESVTEDMALGAVDPMGGFIALGFPAADPGKSPCARKVKVFDGRKRFDVTLTADGISDLDDRGSGRFEGEAYKCRMRFDQVAGYRPKDRFKEAEGDLWVYLAPVPEAVRTPTFAYVPVKVKAKRGIISGTLEAKFPTITGPDGRVYPLYED